ncbi:MAG: BON domain-containing protein [Terrimicrobiaceae bacterium]
MTHCCSPFSYLLSSSCFGKVVRLTLAFAFPLIWTARSEAQVKTGQWDEVVGKDVRNSKGQLLGEVRDSIVDLENGRYVGMLVGFGGVAGLGEKSRIIPPAALRDDGTPRTLFLDMDVKALGDAPVFELSKIGPPDSAKVAATYRYFGQTPFFAYPGNENSPDRLGYLRRGSTILFMPVENLQGVTLGYVAGLRDLNRVTGRLKGVVIQPYNSTASFRKKIVPPQSLRYNLKHTALRLNDHEQAFEAAPAFDMSRSGQFTEEAPDRPGVPPPPLVHGESNSDKAITRDIIKRISAERGLSNYGRNIEVATLNGKATIRGRAVSEANRNRLVALATGVAGTGNVIAEIEVRPMTEAEKKIDQ